MKISRVRITNWNSKFKASYCDMVKTVHVNVISDTLPSDTCLILPGTSFLQIRHAAFLTQIFALFFFPNWKILYRPSPNTDSVLQILAF